MSQIRLKSLIHLLAGLLVVRFFFKSCFGLFSPEKDSAVYLSWIDDGQNLENFHPLFA